MMKRNKIRAGIEAAYENADTLSETLSPIQLPDTLKKWLGRLKLLYGVPINYLVPDEIMLPPESIRFFYVDMNWVDALVDGAYSIGRNLTVDQVTPGLMLDKSQKVKVHATADQEQRSIRAAYLGVDAPSCSFETVSGFMLRSRVVSEYPGLGVNAFPEGHAPGSTDPQMLKILRMERLGPESDTLICLICGDAYQVDVHEPPEALHYGIDRYGKDDSLKRIHLFSKKDGRVTMSDQLADINLSEEKCFRTNSPRTMKMTNLAAQIGAKQNPPIGPVDASEMGFEMTEGVGNVSFINRGTNS